MGMAVSVAYAWGSHTVTAHWIPDSRIAVCVVVPRRHVGGMQHIGV